MQILRSLDQECLHLIQSARAFTETDVNNFPLSLRQEVMSRLKVPGERHSKMCPRCYNAVLMMSNILLYTSRDLLSRRQGIAGHERMHVSWRSDRTTWDRFWMFHQCRCHQLQQAIEGSHLMHKQWSCQRLHLQPRESVHLSASQCTCRLWTSPYPFCGAPVSHIHNQGVFLPLCKGNLAEGPESWYAGARGQTKIMKVSRSSSESALH